MLVVRNIGHFDNEVDLAGSEGLKGTHVDNIKPQILNGKFQHNT